MLLSDYLIQILLMQYKAKSRRTTVEYLSQNYPSGKASSDATCRNLNFYIRQVLYLKFQEPKNFWKYQLFEVQSHSRARLWVSFKVVESRLFLVTVAGFTGSREKLTRKACYRLITAFVFTDNMKYHYEKKCSSFSFVFSKIPGKLFHNSKTP